MALANLDKYHPREVHGTITNTITFLFHMNGPRDVLLADLATEMAISDNRFFYKGFTWVSNGPDKFQDPNTGEWYARILGAVKEERPYI